MRFFKSYIGVLNLISKSPVEERLSMFAETISKFKLLSITAMVLFSLTTISFVKSSDIAVATGFSEIVNESL